MTDLYYYMQMITDLETSVTGSWGDCELIMSLGRKPITKLLRRVSEHVEVRADSAANLNTCDFQYLITFCSSGDSIAKLSQKEYFDIRTRLTFMTFTQFTSSQLVACHATPQMLGYNPANAKAEIRSRATSCAFQVKGLAMEHVS
jgi:hypothetical protein